MALLALVRSTAVRPTKAETSRELSTGARQGPPGHALPPPAAPQRCSPAQPAGVYKARQIKNGSPSNRSGRAKSDHGPRETGGAAKQGRKATETEEIECWHIQGFPVNGNTPRKPRAALDAHAPG
jgi:hypothetical protein